MLAKIEGFVSRAEANLRPPESISRNITPQKGGLAVHWWGIIGRINSHDDCIRTWREGQKYHMDKHGWVDLAYNFGFCQHGYVLSGRGLGIRSAANGTNEGNQYFLAAVWLGGVGMIPTIKALRALLWIILEVRREGGAGKAVKPHRDFTGSQCPGDELHGEARKLNGKRVRDVPRTIRPGDRGVAVRRARQRLRKHGYMIPKTGVFEQQMAKSVSEFKTKRGLKGRPVINAKVWKMLMKRPRRK